MKIRKVLDIQPCFIEFFYDSMGNIKPALLIVTNLSKNIIAMKVKTNAPRDYMVKPNICFIYSEQSIRLSVTPSSSIQPNNSRVWTHKFRIVFIPYTSYNLNIHELFATSKNLFRNTLPVHYTRIVDGEGDESVARSSVSRESGPPLNNKLLTEISPLLKTPMGEYIKVDGEENTFLPIPIIGRDESQIKLSKIMEEQKKVSHSAEQETRIRGEDEKMSEKKEEKMDMSFQQYSEVDKEKTELDQELERLQNNSSIGLDTEVSLGVGSSCSSTY